MMLSEVCLPLQCAAVGSLIFNFIEVCMFIVFTDVKEYDIYNGLGGLT